MHAAPFALLGTISVILGGLVAAVAGPAQWERGSWAAAYLVLVTGVAQIGLGAAGAVLGAGAPSRAATVTELLCWNLGSALVVGGQLLESVPAVVVGSGLLVVALVLWERGVRGSKAGAWVWAYRALGLILIVSIPVGVTLSALRA